MRTKMELLTAATAAFLLAASPLPAFALSAGGVNVNTGNSGGTTSASAGTGSTSATATIGGGSNVASTSVGDGSNSADVTIGGGSNVASTSVGADGTSSGVSIGTGAGGLASVDTTGNTTTGAVNLGGLLGTAGTITPPIGTPVDGPTTPVVTQVADSFGALSSGEQRELRFRCKTIMASPTGFDDSLVSLCRLIASIH